MTSTTLAYLDPSGSSLIIQIIGGGIAAMGLTVRLYWRRIRAFLHIGGRDDDEPRDPEPGSH